MKYGNHTTLTLQRHRRLQVHTSACEQMQSRGPDSACLWPATADSWQRSSVLVQNIPSTLEMPRHQIYKVNEIPLKAFGMYAMQVITWKDSSPKWCVYIICRVRRKTLLTYSACMPVNNINTRIHTQIYNAEHSQAIQLELDAWAVARMQRGNTDIKIKFHSALECTDGWSSSDREWSKWVSE